MDRAANPYRPAPGSQPPALVGREAELSAASNAIALTQGAGAAQPIVFTGLRGMGKTALLRRCAAEAEKRGGIVLMGEAGDDYALVDAFRRSLDRAKRDLRNLPAKLRDTLDSTLAALHPKFELPHDMGSIAVSVNDDRSQRESLVNILDELNRAAWRNDRFLVIAIDEVQDARADQLLPVITFVHETSGTNTPALLLGAGLPNSPAHLHEVRTYTERWRYFSLGLLSPEETREAIALPAHERDVEFEPAALDRLVEVTAGYPFFIQDYASAVWIERTSDIVSLADVERVIPGVQKNLETGYYDARFRTLTPREIRYVLAMADLGEGVHTVSEVAEALGTKSEALSSIRNQLVRKDVVFAPASGLLEFRMPLTERYIAAHREALERRALI